MLHKPSALSGYTLVPIRPRPLALNGLRFECCTTASPAKSRHLDLFMLEQDSSGDGGRSDAKINKTCWASLNELCCSWTMDLLAGPNKSMVVL
jgi:hypothetical protein